MTESVVSKTMSGCLLVVSPGTIDTLEDGKELDRQEAEQISASDHKKVICDERGVIHKEDVLVVTEVLKNMIDSLPIELRSVRVAVVVYKGSMSIASF